MNTDIVTGNKLIAIFDMPENSLDGDWIIWHDSHRTRQHASALNYHENWNSLMRVLIKISLIPFPKENGWSEEDYKDFSAYPYPRTFGMRNPEGKFMVRLNANQLFEADTLIEATWLSVIDYLKWFNDQPKTNKISRYMSKEVLQMQRQIKKDEIVDMVSRMVKDDEHVEIRGMTEVAYHWITDIDQKLFELQQIENQIANYDIDKI